MFGPVGSVFDSICGAGVAWVPPSTAAGGLLVEVSWECFWCCIWGTEVDSSGVVVVVSCIVSTGG